MRAVRAASGHFSHDIVERHQHECSSTTERGSEDFFKLFDEFDEVFRCEILFEIDDDN